MSQNDSVPGGNFFLGLMITGGIMAVVMPDIFEIAWCPIVWVVWFPLAWVVGAMASGMFAAGGGRESRESKSYEEWAQGNSHRHNTQQTVSTEDAAKETSAKEPTAKEPADKERQAKSLAAARKLASDRSSRMLMAYINKAKWKGKSNAQIKDLLLEQGWDEELVNSLLYANSHQS